MGDTAQLRIRRATDVLVVKTLRQFLLDFNYSRHLAKSVSTTEEATESGVDNGAFLPDGQPKTTPSTSISEDVVDPDPGRSKVLGATSSSTVVSGGLSGVSSAGGKPVLSEQLEQQRQQFQRFLKNKELFPQTTQTRFHGCLFQGLFVMQMLVGVTVVVLESVSK